MLNKRMKTAIVASGVLLGATAASAAELKNAHLDLSSTGKIIVITEDGQTYSKLETEDLKFEGSVDIKMKSGKVAGYAIYNGACAALCPDGIGFKPLRIGWLDKPKKEVQDSVLFNVSANDFRLPPSPNIQAENIFGECRDRMGVGVKSDVNFKHNMGVTLGIGFHDSKDSKDHEVDDPIDHNDWRFHLVPVEVTCMALDPHEVADTLKFEHGEFKVNDIDLFLSTFSGANTQSNPATTCKKGRVLVRVKTSKAGNVKFKLWTKVGGNKSSKVVDAWSSHDGNGGFETEHINWISISEPTQVQAMAEEMVGSIGLSTPWKEIMLQCSDKAGGGLAQDTLPTDDPFPVEPAVNTAIPPPTTDLTPNPGRPEDPPQGQTLKGDFGIADYGAPKCDRIAKALVSFKSPKADNIHWSLDCKFQNKSGVVATQPHPEGGYMAATLVWLDVTKTVDESCTLRTIAPYAPKDHVTKAHQFICATPSGHSVSNDLQVEPKPNSGISRPPASTVVGTSKPQDKVKADALKRRLEAAKKAADAKRKREAAAAKTRKLKAAQDAAKKAAIAKRKRDAAIKLRKLKLQQQAIRKAATTVLVKRKAAAALARRKAVLKKRAAPNSTGNATQMQMIRRR